MDQSRGISVSGTRRRSHPATRFVVRLFFATAVLATGSLWFSDSIVQALLPLIKLEIQLLDGTFRIDRLKVDQEGRERVIRMEVGLEREIRMNGHIAVPDARGKAYSTIPAASVTLPALIMMVIGAAWPTVRLRTYVWRGMALIPALFILWTVDVPIALWSGVWGLIIEAFEPDRFSPLLIWEHFLHSGGEFALAAAFGCVIAAIGAERAQ